jgi:hypothetical protein
MADSTWRKVKESKLWKRSTTKAARASMRVHVDVARSSHLSGQPAHMFLSHIFLSAKFNKKPDRKM